MVGAMEGGREVEITRDLGLDERQSRVLDMHSVLNFLNVVMHQIEQVGTLVGDDQAVNALIEQVFAVRDGLTDRARTIAQLGRLPEIRARLIGGVAAQRARVPDAQRSLFERHLDTLESVFDVIEQRVAELIERADDANCYRTVSLQHLRANLQQMFNAVEKNSNGRYRIAFSAAERSPGDYLMELDLRSRDGRSIRMPAVLEDVMRDLAANARKYTDPGGWVRVSLAEEDDGLCLQVEDNGRGIPADEIEHVVVFGHRASNVGNRGQTGGGFGLTKAYAVVRTFAGRMWIRSGNGAGTRVRIWLPRPTGAPMSGSPTKRRVAPNAAPSVA